jgi:protein-S-isoprenylcysteine O-methyltransferase Ste14
MSVKHAVEILLFVAFGALLFISAGTWRWPAGWVLLAEVGICGIALSWWLRRHDPVLLAERRSSQFQSMQKSWDKPLLAVLWLFMVGSFVLSGFDAVRFRWSHVPVLLQVVGALLILVYAWFTYLTFRENTYAIPVVKIQTERGHQVVSTGPYAYVRHPMYSGMLFFYIGSPLLLGSWYGLVAAFVSIGILAVRAVLEERTLILELFGYREYAERVRYRLIPGIW